MEYESKNGELVTQFTVAHRSDVFAASSKCPIVELFSK
jgi:hypothetical protein